jgi:hypothetical protein
MKVKVGDRLEDGKYLPIAVVLTQQDKENIANMAPDDTIYAQYPSELLLSEAQMREWIETLKRQIQVR